MPPVGKAYLHDGHTECNARFVFRWRQMVQPGMPRLPMRLKCKRMERICWISARQSTRPGHVEIPPEQELARLAPVLERLKGNLHIPISIDTYYPQVAQKALELRRPDHQDVSGRFSEQVAQVIRSHGAGWIVMHTGGGTADTQEAYPEGVTANVRAFFQTMAQPGGALRHSGARPMHGPWHWIWKIVSRKLDASQRYGALAFAGICPAGGRIP